MSEVFILSIGINKEINRRTIKQTKSIRNTRYTTENKEFVVLGVVMSGVQELKNTRLYINYLF